MKLRASSVENHQHGNRILFTLEPDNTAQDSGAYIEKQRKSDELVLIIDDNSKAIVQGRLYVLDLIPVDEGTLQVAPDAQAPRIPDGPPPGWLADQEKLRQEARLSSSPAGLATAPPETHVPLPAGSPEKPAYSFSEEPVDPLSQQNPPPNADLKPSPAPSQTEEGKPAESEPKPTETAGEVETKDATTEAQTDKVEVKTAPNPPGV